MRTYILILEFYHLLGYIPRHNSKIPLVLYLPSPVPPPYLLPLVPIVLVYSPHSPIPVYQCPPPLPQISSPSPLLVGQVGGLLARIAELERQPRSGVAGPPTTPKQTQGSS